MKETFEEKIYPEKEMREMLTSLNMRRGKSVLPEIIMLTQKISALESKLTEAVEVIKYYSNKDIWKESMLGIFNQICDIDLNENIDDYLSRTKTGRWGKDLNYAGKRAREFLAKQGIN